MLARPNILPFALAVSFLGAGCAGFESPPVILQGGNWTDAQVNGTFVVTFPANAVVPALNETYQFQLAPHEYQEFERFRHISMRGELRVAVTLEDGTSATRSWLDWTPYGTTEIWFTLDPDRGVEFHDYYP